MPSAAATFQLGLVQAGHDDDRRSRDRWVLAQYPQRAIKMIVPFPPAGATDVVGRIVAQMIGIDIPARGHGDDRRA